MAVKYIVQRDAPLPPTNIKATCTFGIHVSSLFDESVVSTNANLTHQIRKSVLIQHFYA